MSQSDINPIVPDRAVLIWLGSVCLLIFLMIVVGGVTRLTNSGLSMVQWQPILGVLPPLNQASWDAAFDAYKAYPEYLKINRGMSLEDFKSIYYWEYGHRVLGRVIGIVFLVPMLVLLALGRVPRPLIPRLLVAFVLGGCQGLLGWYMVKSGLVDVPSVSHFRLAAHFCLAVFVLAYLLWLMLHILGVQRQSPGRAQFIVQVFFMVTLVVQLIYGAFVAGLDAGLGFNTYPMMGDQFIADAAFAMSPWWVNLFENGAMIQFVHRWTAALLVLIGAVGCLLAWWEKRLQLAWSLVFGMLLLQFALGVATLLLYVPLGVASLHQAIAVLLVVAVVFLAYVGRRAS